MVYGRWRFISVSQQLNFHLTHTLSLVEGTLFTNLLCILCCFLECCLGLFLKFQTFIIRQVRSGASMFFFFKLIFHFILSSRIVLKKLFHPTTEHTQREWRGHVF
uniref:Uncharacterized protein n=1 Tax=Cacopsylla melanoneura TaxID=428564 RepID=A0A8D9AG20_9HEMI